MENSNWNDRVRNEGVLHAFKEEKSIPQTTKIRKATGLVT